MRNKEVLIELHYLPSLEYFVCLNKSENIILEINDHYVKQTYRNRCYILTSNKVAPLIIPVKEGNKKIKFKDIKIDYDQKWLNIHWRAIISAYGKAPFFEYFAPYIHQPMFKKFKYLLDLNLQLLSNCLQLLKLEKNLKFTEVYEKEAGNEIDDLRGQIHPKKNFIFNNFYQIIPYNQIFGKNFVSNISIIDLLFCEGGNAGKILQRSTIS
ncbi:WbqC family protein [soil metagenome]